MLSYHLSLSILDSSRLHVKSRLEECEEESTQQKTRLGLIVESSRISASG